MFASYSSPDESQVAEILTGLRALGVRVWFDKWSISGGDSYIQKIAAALQEVPAIAVFIGSETIRPWQNAEVEAAIKLNIDSGGSKRVIPVLISGSTVGSIPALLNLRSAIRFPATTDKEALRLLKCAIEGIEPGPDPEHVPFFGERPYRGLEPFDVSDARFFAGRTGTVRQLVGMVSDLFGRDVPKLLGIVGDSGSGKSSLARAGLIPALMDGHVQRAPSWKYLALKPGSSPLNSLAIAFAGPEPRAADVDRLRDGLDANPEKLGLLAAAYAGSNFHLALLIDQFEETFSLCKNETEAEKFIAALMSVSTVPDCRTLVLLTIRADFYGACGQGHYGDFRTVLNRQHLLIGSMNAEELQLAIREPALRAGYEVENGLVEVLVKDTLDQRGSLPLLQFTLDELWRARTGRRLTLAAYQKMEGLSGALNRRADELYSSVNPEQQAMLKRILLRLVQIGEDGRYLRTRVPLPQLLPGPEASEPSKAVRALLNRLAGHEYRLITMTAMISGEDASPPFVEVTHEALIRNWKTLRQWVEDPQNRDFLIWRQRFLLLLSEWRDSKHDPETQLRGLRLKQAVQWLRERPADFAPEETEFIESSHASDEATRVTAAEEKRKRKREKAIVWGLTAAVVLASAGAVGIALNRPKLDERLAIAGRVLKMNPKLAMSIALRAHAAKPSPESTALVEEAIQASTEAPIEPGGDVTTLKFSADGKQIITGADDGAACVWSLNGTRLYCAPPAESRIAAVSFLDQGKLAVLTANGRLASFSDSGRIMDWHADSKQSVDAAVCSQNGVCVIASSKRACIWRIGQPAPEPCFDVSVPKPLAVAVAGDGPAKIAIAGEDEEAQVIDVATRKGLPVSVAGGMVRSVAFDNRAVVLLTAPQVGPVRLWNAATGNALGGPIHPDGQPVLAATLSPDGAYIVSANSNGAVSVWNIKSGEVSLLVPGPNGKVRGIAVDNRAIRAAIALPNNKVRIYDLDATAVETRACEQEKQFRADQPDWTSECQKYIDKRQCEASCDNSGKFSRR